MQRLRRYVLIGMHAFNEAFNEALKTVMYHVEATAC